MKQLAIHGNFVSTELGNPIILEGLQNNEKALAKVSAKVHLDRNSRCHIAIPTKICKELGLNKGDTVMLRFRFDDKIGIDICTLSEWGRTTLSTFLGKF